MKFYGKSNGQGEQQALHRAYSLPVRQDKNIRKGQNKSDQAQLTEHENPAANISLIRFEERQKIGQELHDSMNSLLVIAKLYLKFWNIQTVDEQSAKEQINYIIQTVIGDIRSISSCLPESEGSDSNIIELVKDLIERINGINLIKINFTHSDSKALLCLTPDIKMIIYRIIQEQLNNTVKYSKAENVRILISCIGSRISLVIKDDGVGFDKDKCACGVGLASIEKRVKSKNGKLQIISMPGKGCKMYITLPL